MIIDTYAQQWTLWYNFIGGEDRFTHGRTGEISQLLGDGNIKNQRSAISSQPSGLRRGI